MKVMAGGTFNMIHKGHVHFLEECRKLGDYLVIVIASDANVKRKKYLLKSASERKKMVEKLGIADKVVIGDKKDIFKIVKKERPDIVALGYDQTINREKLKKMSIKIVKLKKYGNYSTRKIIGK